MLFNSIDFLIFFPLVVGFLFVLPFRHRTVFLLLASYLFYGLANGWFLLLILLSTLIDYLVALKMATITDKKNRKPYLYLSLISNLGMLVIFKYFNFFNESFADLFKLMNLNYAVPALQVLLPVGISFYTFQTLAYSIDVYKGKVKAEQSFTLFALYVTYFPQLVAGPIERSQSLIPQLKKPTHLSYENATNGLKLIAWGFFKKLVIADQIAPMIKYVTDSPEEFYALSVFLCAVLFAYQVYCDFSGYSDIAIGAAQIMGVKLMVNFKQPFSAKRLSEFWARWHISLTSWFKDYVYKDLNGTGKSLSKSYRSLWIVFVLSGLWHGASYNFLMWGSLNGLIIIIFSKYKGQIGRAYKFVGLGKKSNLKGAVQVISTVSLFSIFGIFFFTNDINQAITLYKNLCLQWGGTISNVFLNQQDARAHDLYLGYDLFRFCFVMLSIVFLEYVQYIQKREKSFRQYWDKKPLFTRWIGYLGILMAVVSFAYDREVAFVYFQF